MFGSQALEVAIGLVLLFFVLATAASSVVEACNQILSKRAKDLEAAVVDLITGDGSTATGALPPELQKMLNLGTTKANASYVSAKAFADAVVELVDKAQTAEGLANVQPLLDRLDTLARQAKGDITSVKAGLETWFDERMSDLHATFKRYAVSLLFVIGLGLTVATNASAVDVAQDLWSNSVARDAAVAAAGAVAEGDGTSDCNTKSEIQNAACDVQTVSALDLPLGWGQAQRPDEGTWVWWLATHLLGWLITAALLMVGAPFWFDLLGRLVSFRSERVKPAAQDPGSNTTLLAAPPAGPPTDPMFRGLWAQGYADGAPVDVPPLVGGEVDWLALALNRTTPIPRAPAPAPAPAPPPSPE